MVNPFASSVTQRVRVVLQQALAARHDLTVLETTKSRHAIRLAHTASRNGADVVIPLGGDGTVNEVANGLLHTTTALAPLPGGSTNVFARAMGYPNDPIEATETILEALDQSSIIEGNVGMANDRAFLFHVGAGFDAAVVGRVERRGTLKRYLGHPLFVAATLDTWLRKVDRSSAWFSIEEIDPEQPIVEDLQIAIALNCNPYTFLGNRPLNLAPEASITSRLSIVGLTSLAPHKLSTTITKTLLNDGGVANDGDTHHLSDIGRAVLQGTRPFPYQLDGEFIGEVKQLELSHLPNALRFVVPVSPVQPS